MGKEKLGTFMRLTYQPITTGDDSFADSSGTNTTSFAEAWTTTMAYEFGALYVSGRMVWKFSLEILQPTKLKDNKGYSAAGAHLITVSNELNVVTPKVGFEIILHQWKNSRFFVGGEYGMANLTAQNNYTIVDYAPFTDYREEVKSVGSQFAGMLGFETLMSDTTTICLDVGYRALTFTSLVHNNEATTLSQGAVVKGTSAQNNDGTARAVNLSGVYASLWFRIWLY